ncbi:MAG TPA: crosslink repair DNA glycosylase YcaQ family protein [Polyangiaceae bacterium]|jgi:hypothetical protein|nr:crosslink repair DNA glycosylase YcaQ family protein [Polyangiaceae bacterium]
MDTGTLIDALVRQTTVLIAQLATAGGNRAHLAHTANQVFLDLVAALREQGLGSKVIADMFGMALRTYHQRVQRLSESRTERGRTLWEAVLEFVTQRGPVSRGEVMRRFSQDDEVVLRSLLKDLVGSGLISRSGRGDHVRYQVALSEAVPADSPAETLADLVCLTAYRLAPASVRDVAATLSLEPELVLSVVGKLLDQGRLRRAGLDASGEPRFTSEGCVIPLGEQQGWEIAVFDHYQALVTTLCAKLRKGKQRASAADLTGGSTFSYTVWQGHPHYEEATQFLAEFRRRGAALRGRIADYNEQHAPGDHADPGERVLDQRAVKVLIYAGQSVIEADLDERAPQSPESSDDDEDDDALDDAG